MIPARLEPLHQIRITALLVAPLLGACASWAPTSGGNTAAATRPPAPHVAPSSPRTMADSVPARFGVRALRAVALSGDDIDVRVSTGASMTFGATTLLRVTRTKGVAAGEVYLVWSADTSTVSRRAEANLLGMPLLRDHGCVAPRRTGTSAACR